MFAYFISLWPAVCLLFSIKVIGLSLTKSPTSGRYRMATYCFAIISLGSAVFISYPLFFFISMGNAFGPSSASFFTYALPILPFIAFGYSALSLFPFLSAEKGRKAVLGMVGLVILWVLWTFFREIIRWPQGYGLGVEKRNHGIVLLAALASRL
jgi:hypothetical protein